MALVKIAIEKFTPEIRKAFIQFMEVSEQPIIEGSSSKSLQELKDEWGATTWDDVFDRLDEK